MSDVEELKQRLSKEFSGLTETISKVQADAAKEFQDAKARYESFRALAVRVVEEVIDPRVEALKGFFQNVVVKRELFTAGAPAAVPHGGRLTLALSHTMECPAKVTLSLQIGHDEKIENLIVGYRLEILPIFFDYKKSDELATPIAAANLEEVARWLDDRLVGFVRDYLKIQTIDNYQRELLVTDPVLNHRFPRTFAKTQRTHKGSTYYFLTDETAADFDKDPSRYLAAG